MRSDSYGVSLSVCLWGKDTSPPFKVQDGFPAMRQKLLSPSMARQLRVSAFTSHSNRKAPQVLIQPPAAGLPQDRSRDKSTRVNLRSVLLSW